MSESTPETTPETGAANPVLDLLARTPAPELVGGLSIPDLRARPITVRYGEGKPGISALSGATLPLFLGAVLVLLSFIVVINVIRLGEVSLNAGMGIVLPLVIAAFVAGPALLRARAGNLQWRREASIFADRVEVSDRTGEHDVSWSAPLSEFKDVHQAFTYIPARNGEGDGLELEVVHLRHPEAGKSIYVSGTRKVTMGGMSFSDMIKAGREGRKEEVTAAVGDTRNPAVEALVAELVELTGLPLTPDFK
ncbi:hypothetical protein [Gymnodinialimonas ceratoperidinii]|uniref:Uncharacterized protein n=1 Tax=Gymnodinialimonas ceratoperidinii TaxID=2856823 RepID=A0A8F6Y9Q1_9RHOB|nr:hypothetical protein [Gymnodinialimonas ceratoperidinii]QXT38783.1 hypothetical protein KYE46_12670 [Gymnodinialimonas ceratoperidinii]